MLSGVKVRGEATVVTAVAVAALLPDIAVMVVTSTNPMVAPAVTVTVKFADSPEFSVTEDALNCTVQGGT